MTLRYDPVGSQCLKNQPGTIALRDALLPKFPPCTNLGIYVCRDVRGGSSLSVHSEGRAWDAGFPDRHPQGAALAEFLVKNADFLGVQRVIWDRMMWGGSGGWTWRAYSGQDPHNTHVHVELNWTGAKYLTTQAINTLFTEEDMTADESKRLTEAHGAISRIEGTKLPSIEQRLSAIEAKLSQATPGTFSDADRALLKRISDQFT